MVPRENAVRKEQEVFDLDIAEYEPLSEGMEQNLSPDYPYSMLHCCSIKCIFFRKILTIVSMRNKRLSRLLL